MFYLSPRAPLKLTQVGVQCLVESRCIILYVYLYIDIYTIYVNVMDKCPSNSHLHTLSSHELTFLCADVIFIGFDGTTSGGLVCTGAHPHAS